MCSLSDVQAGILVAWMIHNCSSDAVMFGQLSKSLKVYHDVARTFIRRAVLDYWITMRFDSLG
jgi:hypothetical protein